MGSGAAAWLRSLVFNLNLKPRPQVKKRWATTLDFNLTADIKMRANSELMGLEWSGICVLP